VTFIVVAVIFVISRDAWVRLPQGLLHVGAIPPQLGFALVMGAFAFAGSGGGANPAAIRITPIRIAALTWATLLFGFLAVLTFNQQIRNLLS
jgi:hypothetical protein